MLPLRDSWVLSPPNSPSPPEQTQWVADQVIWASWGGGGGGGGRGGVGGEGGRGEERGNPVLHQRFGPKNSTKGGTIAI